MHGRSSLESGGVSAALVTVDAGSVPEGLWQTVTQQVQREFGIPATHLLLTATHTHSAGRHTRPGATRRPSWTPSGRPGRAPRARARRLRHRCLLHQRQSHADRSAGRIAGGKAPTTTDRRTRRSRCCAFQTAGRAAPRRLLQLRRACGACGAARRGERRHSRRRVPIPRRIPRRGCRGRVVVRRRWRPEPTLLSADARPARDPDRRSTRRGASTSATRCLRAAKGSTARTLESRSC